MTDFTRKQGETFKVTLSLKDGQGYPIKLAENTSTPLKYFGGVVDDGTTEHTFNFKYGASETITSGTGAGEVTDTGIFTVICYIEADTTATMAAKAWNYAIRMSDTVNPTGTDNVRVLLEGSLTIENSLYTITGATTYTAPSA